MRSEREVVDGGGLDDMKKSVGISSEGESKSENASGEKVYFACEVVKEGRVVQGDDG